MISRPTQFIAIVGLAVLALIPMTSVNAGNTAQDFFTWTGMEITGDFPATAPYAEKLKYKLFMQGRFGDHSTRFSQGLIRLGTGYAINKKVIAWVGYDWVPTSRPLALHKPFNDHAVWQQLSLIDDYAFGQVVSRTRFEQHFFDIPGSTDTAHLFRQMFKLTTPLPLTSPNVSLVIWNEVFANLNSTDAGTQSGFNQNRAFMGIGYHLSKEATLEIGYINQYINRPNNVRPDQMLHLLSINMLLNF